MVEAGGKLGKRVEERLSPSALLNFWNFEPYSLKKKKKTQKPSLLKDCEPAAASVPCLEMKLRQRPAGLDMEKPITNDIKQAPGSCCFQSLSSHVRPQSLLSGLSLSELCWQVS